MAWGVYDYPEPSEKEVIPVCPVCGEECDTIYKNKWGDIVGCEECVQTHEALEIMEEL